ncbi:MAG: NifU family protein [Thermomicrobiales bacterium]
MTQARNLRQAGDQIEALLTELRSVADPTVSAKAEELVRLLVEVYGAGLERIVELVWANEATAQEQMQRLASDELVASLLILHGLHPVDLESRVQQALDKVRPYLGSHAGGCEFLGVDDEGVVHLQLEGSCHGCPSSTITVKLAIERAIMEAAPEVTRIQVEGVSERPSERVISIDSLRRNGHAASGANGLGEWTVVDGLGNLSPGQLTAIEVGGIRVVVCHANDSFYAYRNDCPACGSSWHDDGLAEEVLTCPRCGERFNVRLAGRGVDQRNLYLQPLPLLAEGGTIQIAVPGAGA